MPAVTIRLLCATPRKDLIASHVFPHNVELMHWKEAEVEGFYAVYYTGVAGFGHAVLVMKDDLSISGQYLSRV